MTNNIEFNTDLSSLEPYILGKSFTGVCKNQTRCDQEVLENFLTLLEEDSVAKGFFEAFDLASDFYKTMIDFKEFIPKEQRDEVFYAAKNGGTMYKQIPSFCVYVLRKAWEQCNGIPNLLFKIVPITAIKKFCEEGYFLGGLSLHDVVCNVCTEEYSPLSLYHPKNKLKDFTEIYVASTDMVAAVPHSIAEHLDDNSISTIKVTPNGLETNGVLLRTMANHVGAINSVYDLRELL